jgi:hypothetical protein
LIDDLRKICATFAKFFYPFYLINIQTLMFTPRFTVRPWVVCFLSFCALNISAQVSYTADEKLIPYPGLFASGYNQGFFSGWNDTTLADIAAGNPAKNIQGCGTKAVRQGLYFELLRTYGQNIRVPHMQHYQKLGMVDGTALILGGGNGGSTPYPPDDVRDLTMHCPGISSHMFANMYLPIWDGGANGTPYNDQNHYAKYLYETVTTYKPYIKFWEIWNEPGYDETHDTAWRPPGDPQGNWWDRDPLPCESRLRAPVEHYVRMLRISYDIIKTIDPTAYVYMSSPGTASFLDAVCRNTDNPSGGSITAEYPKLGGAYFDGVAYHSYPHFDGSTTIDAWTQTYMRHSDRCADGMLWYRNNLQTVLNTYGYNGVQKPQKEFIITEINLPRKQFTNPVQHFGSQEAQRNYLIKSYVLAKKEKIHQLHVYLISEHKTEAEAQYEFDLMGLYNKIDNKTAQQIQKTQEGVAWKTVSDQLYNTWHDNGATFALNLPAGVRGGAFQRTDGKTCYVLWAECTVDKSEIASASYTFPSTLAVKNAQMYRWDASLGVAPTTAAALTQVQLTGDPLFIVADVSTATSAAPDVLEQFSVSPNPVQAGQDLRISYALKMQSQVLVTVTNVLGSVVLTSAEGIKTTDAQTLDLCRSARSREWLRAR